MNIALIVAGGIGKRMGIDIPKQFIEINNKPIIYYTIKAFQDCENINSIYVVCHKDYLDYLNTCIKNYSFNKVKQIVIGGATRQESVFNGLKAIKSDNYKDDDVILIHDAARALISDNIITNNIEACEKYGACETAIKVSDTIIRSDLGEYVDVVLNRNVLYQVQTPQTFKLKLIYDAHLNTCNADASDDAQLIKDLGYNVAIVPGNKFNFKITTIDDLNIFKSLIK